MIIDIFSHHVSRSVGEKLRKGKYFGEGGQHPYPEQNADPEVRLELMDKYGIDTQALSQTTPILLSFNAEDAAEICRLSNNDNYALCKAYPDRFVNICIISLLDVRSALRELDRSINELDCRGVTVASNQDGKGLDSREYFPFYEKLAENDLPLLIHPTYPSVNIDKKYGLLLSVLGWPFDTSLAVLRLILGGVLDAYPSLKIVTHHMGAMLPYFTRRIENSIARKWKDKLTRDISQYWSNIYGDTAVDGTTAAYPLGYAFFGPDRLMYGSDYPFGANAGEDQIKDNLAGVMAMNIPAQDREKILGGNAKKILKIK